MRSWPTALLVLALLWQAPARAGESSFDPERLAVAREIIEASGANALTEQVLRSVSAQIATLIQQYNPERGAAVADIIDAVVLPEASRRIPEATEAMARLYAERFTAEELQDVVDFYRTPTGRKLVALSPELFVEAQRVGQAWARLLIEDLWDDILQRLEENGLKPPPAI
ncbi:MAG: hypothetical protein K0S81_3713 [Rhodospirillales bacterium]|jgi:hypothetical protein|nr:hypothetical protein [Rhodospirillales bacterium]